MSKRRIFVPELMVLSATFFFIFLGPGAVQQHLDKVLGDKRFYVLATVYLSFCFWRVFVGITIQWLGDFLSELFGAATYVLFAATMLFSTSWPVVLVAACVWGWGAASFWITSQSQVLDATRRYGASSGLLYAFTVGGQALGVGLLALIAARWQPTGGWTLTEVLLGTCVVLGVPGLVLICLVPRRKVERTPFSLRAFWAIASQKPIVLVGIIQLLSALSYGVLLGILSEIAKATAGGQWPTVPFYVARLVLVFPAGALADRIGKERVLKFSFLLAAAGLLVAVMWRSSPGLSLGICAAAMATQSVLAASNSMALMGDIAKSENRHMALGAVFFWRDLGVVIPLFIAGALKGRLARMGDATAVADVFYTSLFGFAAVLVASAFICDALRRSIEAHRSQASEG